MATSSPHHPLSSANVGALLNRAGDGVELQASTWVMALTAAELQPWRPSAGQGFSPSASRGESSAVQVGVQSSVALAALNMTRRSLRDTARVLGVTRSFLSGLELAELFYADVVAPIVDKALAGVSYSAALIGWGSEVQGFDTQRSTDHAWGPRMQLFLGRNEFLARANELDALLDHELPAEFRGYPVRFAFPSDAPARHWVHVTDLRDFFTEHLGADPAGGLATSVWLTVPTQVLRELTGGMVFHDGLGLLEPYRKELAWFPDDVWRYVLACQWMRLSQEEPFVGRCGEVGDDLGSAVVAARQVRDLMKLCLLMNRVYPPYSKWLGTAFAALPCALGLTPHLSDALSARRWQEREQHLSSAYEIAAGLHNELGLTEPLDVEVRYFHDRPFRVLDAYRFTNALVSTISDPALSALPPVGAIDQYVDNTDLTDRTHAELRRRYIAGPGLDF